MPKTDSMDREITPQERRKALRKQIIIYGCVALAAAGLLLVVFNMARDSVNVADLKFAAVDRGDVDATIPASGTVAPAFEEVINSPISSKVVEVYHRAGDVCRCQQE